jgi:hypothetical protein
VRCERIRAIYARPIAFFFSFWRFLLLQSAVTVMRSKALHYTYVYSYKARERERERWKLFKLQLQLRVISWIDGAAFLLRCREFQYTFVQLFTVELDAVLKNRCALWSTWTGEAEIPALLFFCPSRRLSKIGVYVNQNYSAAADSIRREREGRGIEPSKSTAGVYTLL